jgi:hypothetical protein
MKNGTMASGFTMASKVTRGLKSIMRPCRLWRGRRASPEHAIAFHVHHRVAVLVEHFPHRTHQAHVGALAQWARFQDRCFSTSVSPGNTGLSHLRFSNPGEPWLTVSAQEVVTISRMARRRCASRWHTGAEHRGLAT